MPRGTSSRIGKLGSLLALAAIVASVLPPGASANAPPQELALVRATADGHLSIVLWDREENLQGLLVDLPGRDAIQPAWSPDGQTLLFAAQTEPGGPFALFSMRPGGSMTEHPSTNRELEQLTFPTGADDPSEGDFSPSWSPDGHWIAFARTMDGGSKIFYRYADVFAEDRLTSDPYSYEVEPSWMPDSTTVVFANRALEPGPGDDPNHPTFRFQIVEASRLRRTFATSLTAERGFDFRTPDVSPDGSAIAAAATFSGVTISVIVPLTPLGPPDYAAFEGDRNPDWSPDGTMIVADRGPDNVVFTGESGSAGGTEGSDAAWRPPDRTPPHVVITPLVDEEGWLFRPEVTVTSEDDVSGILVMWCVLDGEQILKERPPDPLPTTLVATASIDGREGVRTLACSATDGSGNVGTTSVVLRVDAPPRLGTPTFQELIRVGEPVEVTVPFEEVGSGLDSTDLLLRSKYSSLHSPMTEAGSYLVGSERPWSGIYEVVVTATDRRGNTASVGAPDRVVVFDPAAGSATGSGSIVPGGPTSDPGDVLPEVDGQTKASFSFSAQYRSESSATTSGSVNVSYGSRFKLKSTGLIWLLRDGYSALFQGTAEIHGRPGIFVFQVEVIDSHVDRFELRVWPSDAHPFSDPPLFQATGDVGGQIHVRF